VASWWLGIHGEQMIGIIALIRGVSKLLLFHTV